MTAPDTNMTLDANSHAGDGTVLAALVLGNLAAARGFGLDAAALAAAAGLTPDELDNPDGRISFSRHVALLEAIERAPSSAELGLWMGKHLQIETLGVVGYVMQHAPDVRTALGCLDRFQRLLGDGIGPELREEAGCLVLERVEPPHLAGLMASSLAAPLGTVTLVNQLVGGAPSEPIAVEVTFQHPPVPEHVLAELLESLRCPVHFNAEATRLKLRASILEAPLVAPNPGLFDYLGRHAAALQARVQTSVTLGARVRELLAAQLREGEPAQASIARRLGLSERTLQRRLSEEGLAFAALVDEMRAELARLYLGDPKLAVFEVAFLLGYSEPSAFNRAFRRWTGQSPSQFRAQAPNASS